jgi:hypothetical protein
VASCIVKWGRELGVAGRWRLGGLPCPAHDDGPGWRHGAVISAPWAEWRRAGSQGGWSEPVAVSRAVCHRRSLAGRADDGSGSALYAGATSVLPGAWRHRRREVGRLELVGARRRAPRTPVNALAVFDDGGGRRSTPEDPSRRRGGANGIAKWDGSSWAALAGGVAATSMPRIR